MKPLTAACVGAAAGCARAPSTWRAALRARSAQASAKAGAEDRQRRAGRRLAGLVGGDPAE